MAGYDHQKIEKETREAWEAHPLVCDLADNSKDPYYLLFEFPYPSGDLHIGHWYAFALTDVYARYLRMKGKNVLFPIGFDAFGLPAENAAMKNGADPKEWTYKNMDRMRAQIKTMGTSVDWSKEIVTCEPSYYKWTQWLFAKLFEHGLAYRKNAAVKWCPKDQTVLANEQVSDGRCERCGSSVEERHLTQWFLKITEYAERLLAGLETLPWREEIKDAQRAWIGKSEGARISFQLVVDGFKNEELKTENEKLETIEVFTTRPDTLFGATYVVLAPEHPLVEQITNNKQKTIKNTKEIQKYVEQTKKKTELERSENKEKTGVKIDGVMAVNPATKEEIPIYVADYVLGSYGTGAVMAVPAHDERDFEFAQKMNLPIRKVIESANEDVYTDDGTLSNSGEFTGRNNREAMGDIVAFAGGERQTQYRIRDWLVSRQRYWGCPIPIVYDPEGNPHIIPAEHLPWELPTDVDFTPTGKSPLASSKELKARVEKIFGEGWTPEYDTLDTFVDSSWYYMRYLDSKDNHDFSDQALMKKWLPVNRYSGGSDHTTMHLLYARFFHKALHDLALVPEDEPFYERFNRGFILGPDGAKMSKSKGNVVNPDEVVKELGADAVRCFLAFMGPYNEPGSYPWKLEGAGAMRKFLDRVYALSKHLSDKEPSEALMRELAKASTKVADDTERFKLNTALSALMICLRALEAEESVSKKAYREFLQMLAPFAPHLADYLFIQVGGSEFRGSVHQSTWPTYDPALLVSDRVTIVVQVNGKRRAALSVDASLTEEDIIALALAEPAVATALAGRTPARKIFVPGKLLNLVVE